jgi:hypothetical protein
MFQHAGLWWVNVDLWRISYEEVIVPFSHLILEELVLDAALWKFSYEDVMMPFSQLILEELFLVLIITGIG